MDKKTKNSVEQTVVDRVVEDGDKEKKKSRRRSNRRSKHSNSTSGCIPAVDGQGEQATYSGSRSKAKKFPSSSNFSSSNQHGLANDNSNEYDASIASNVVFSSMPTMHLNEPLGPGESLQQVTMHSVESDDGGSMFVKLCPGQVAGTGPYVVNTSKDLLPSNHRGVYVWSKTYAPHWTMDAVDNALEKGHLFKASFHVNAHDRLEAYCKIDGVPVDILINGVIAQNRAVVGDTVAIQVDPLPFWTRMRGSTGSANEPTLKENSSEATNEVVMDRIVMSSQGCSDKQKVDGFCGSSFPKNPVPSGQDAQDCRPTGKASFLPSNCRESNELVKGLLQFTSDYADADSSSQPSRAEDAIGKLCALVGSYPSKRPTGKVVSIIDRSPRRDAVVGFLKVKQLLSYRDRIKKELKKNKSVSLFPDEELIQLAPTDPRFPEMMVPVKGLPECIKERLKDLDPTVERELVAAQIDEWNEESLYPYAHILHVFGRGGEVESHMKAILFEHAIYSSEFSSESLGCLPYTPWEVPQPEYQRRGDLRNLCIFTIDPSSATDLDDALSIEELPSGIYRVGVHIADVTYFVQPNTSLDMDAQMRSTSVYLIKRKLPMLPPLLSEDLGSLKPGVDRLAFSIFWDINSFGDIIDRWICHTVVRSCCKLSYEDAQGILDGSIDVDNCNDLGNSLPLVYGQFKWADVMKSVKTLSEISKTLKENRLKAGALQLENSKVVFLFDEHGVPYDSMLCQRKDSNFLVEEFMLLANRTAAEVISRAFPETALLRRHPEPNMRKLREFEAFCSKHGLELDTSSSSRFHTSLEKIRETLKDDSGLFDIIISYAARPMQVAAYFCMGDFESNEDEWGHYALAIPLYTHFTSPLRRYPDIIVHRMMAAALEAEELYLKKRASQSINQIGTSTRCFTGISFDKDAADSDVAKEAFVAASMKHGLLCRESLADVAAYCNERKLASRHVKDGCDKLYMWFLLKKKKILITEARVLGLGPRFMSIYIPKLAVSRIFGSILKILSFGAFLNRVLILSLSLSLSLSQLQFLQIERRINYDEVEGLFAEWLETTSTLMLTLAPYKPSSRRGLSNKYRPLADAALVVNPSNLGMEGCGSCEDSLDTFSAAVQKSGPSQESSYLDSEISPLFFPMTLHLLSTIPVALHAVGGDDGPIDIRARLYVSTYLR